MNELGELLEQARLPASRWNFEKMGLKLEIFGKKMPEPVYLGS